MEHHSRGENITGCREEQLNKRVNVVSVHYILDSSYQSVRCIVFSLYAFYIFSRTFYGAACLGLS